MNQRAHERIAAAASALAGKMHSQDELEDALFLLVNECYLPEARPVVPVRRMPVAGEVLPPQQRATWARATTIYDTSGASIVRGCP